MEDSIFNCLLQTKFYGNNVDINDYKKMISENNKINKFFGGDIKEY